MASVKVKFRSSAVDGNVGAVYYQIIHDRKVRRLPTDYRIYPSEWSDSSSTVVTTMRSERYPVVISIRENINRDIEQLSRIVKRFETKGLLFSASDIVNEFQRYEQECSLLNFMGEIIVKLKQNGKIRTAETYISALNSFTKFIDISKAKGHYFMGNEIMLYGITSDIVEYYESYLHSRGVTPNTISFYMRILRAVYNRAVEKDLIEQSFPFRHVYTGIDKTVKRALPLAVIKKIKALDLSLCPALDYARDMFLMSFCLRGMSFIDMAFLRKSDLRNGHVLYRRRKTGQRLTIEWTKEMQVVIDKYPESRAGYLLPIIRNTGINERCAYRNMSYNINRSLKKIAQMINADIPLTLYVARHSWASAAKSNGIPISVISEGMGHDSETTTRIYLASLDTAVVDRANSIILKSL